MQLAQETAAQPHIAANGPNLTHTNILNLWPSVKSSHNQNESYKLTFFIDNSTSRIPFNYDEIIVHGSEQEKSSR